MLRGTPFPTNFRYEKGPLFFYHAQEKVEYIKEEKADPNFSNKNLNVFCPSWH